MGATTELPVPESRPSGFHGRDNGTASSGIAPEWTFERGGSLRGGYGGFGGVDQPGGVDPDRQGEADRQRQGDTGP
jgi:hypothetical protein